MNMDKKLIKMISYFALFMIFLSLGIMFAGDISHDIEENQSVFGIELQGASLFVAAFVIGLVDGFNPCAMWVLIYMITLVSQLDDKRKMITIVGIFLFASGALYFAILALWFFGWLSIETLLPPYIFQVVGLFAVGFGLYLGYDLWKNGGEAVCRVDMKSKRKTQSRIRSIIENPFTFATLVSTVVLAFAINSIEFVCSAGLPAIFTQLLVQTNASVGEALGYISVYTFAFMLDDLLVFYLALKAIDPGVLHKYSAYSKGIGAVIIFLIGIVVLFFPNLLL